MREDNLLCLRHRKFVVTTDSKHDLPVYPNLAKAMVLTSINQLWRADITYIRLVEEFVYLAVMLDAYSRRVIGWALDRTLQDRLTITALEMALAQRGATAGLVHHSDRGVQYASHDYTRILQEHGIRISMSRTGNPWDNAACESFMKTLKYEEVYRSEYRDLADAYARIGEFLEEVYNQKRLHSALDYRSPAAFEQSLLSSPTLVEVRGMSFLRHGEIYPCDKGTISRPCPLPITMDEFPAGYSWRVALQQSPRPLHQPTPLCGCSRLNYPFIEQQLCHFLVVSAQGSTANLTNARRSRQSFLGGSLRGNQGSERRYRNSGKR